MGIHLIVVAEVDSDSAASCRQDELRGRSTMP